MVLMFSLGTGPYIIVFDLNTNEQLLQEKIFHQSIVHGFEIRKIYLKQM